MHSHMEAMPQIVVRIADDQMAWLDSQTRPFHTKSDVVRDLIHTARQGLTTSATLVERREAPPQRGDSMSEASSLKAVTSLITNNKTNKREVRSSKVKRTKGTPEFEQFWVVYQSCPKKANCQSKAKAWECWDQLVPDLDPAQLIKAAQRAVDEANDREMAGEFCAPLPDAFRWLRDERYAVLLEGHTPAQTQRIKLF